MYVLLCVLQIYPPGSDKKAVLIPICASLMHEVGHGLQNAEATDWYVKYSTLAIKANADRDKKAAQLEIENKNLKDNEIPILKFLKMPYREEYHD